MWYLVVLFKDALFYVYLFNKGLVAAYHQQAIRWPVLQHGKVWAVGLELRPPTFVCFLLPNNISCFRRSVRSILIIQLQYPLCIWLVKETAKALTKFKSILFLIIIANGFHHLWDSLVVHLQMSHWKEENNTLLIPFIYTFAPHCRNILFQPAVLRLHQYFMMFVFAVRAENFLDSPHKFQPMATVLKYCQPIIIMNKTSYFHL